MSDIDPGFGVYVHWPFCKAICPYCDFNVHLNTSIDETVWRDALINELAHYGAETHGRTVTSLYFGGGTPSLMQPETIAALINALQKHWAVSENLEITLEVSPVLLSTVSPFLIFVIASFGIISVKTGLLLSDLSLLSILFLMGFFAGKAISGVTRGLLDGALAVAVGGCLVILRGVVIWS